MPAAHAGSSVAASSNFLLIQSLQIQGGQEQGHRHPSGDLAGDPSSQLQHGTMDGGSLSQIKKQSGSFE